jgi:hypothetical protein
VPTGRTRSAFEPLSNGVLARTVLVGSNGTLRINPDLATQCVRKYNSDSYRGTANVVLDRQAYALFRNGISLDPSRLPEQISFVGERYGGAQERFGSIRKEAELITQNFGPIADKWLRSVTEAKPLALAIPDRKTVDFFFSPFVGSKQWPVWASKTLHFLRPDVFPILDSNAKKPLGLVNLVNSSRSYHTFCSVFRDVLLANADSLAAARVVDRDGSPTDVKLLDKILFQLGLSMK